MVQRQQSLADLLADDMGNLRPEVVDLVMGRAPLRVVHQNRHIPRWVFVCLGIVVLIIIISSLSDKDEVDDVASRRDMREYLVENTPEREIPNVENRSPVVRYGPPPEKAYPKRLWKKHTAQVQNQRSVAFSNKPKTQMNTRPQYNQEAVTKAKVKTQPLGLLGKAKVFGYDVNIRKSPSLRARVIRQTDQGERFQVMSFSDGWYKLRLDGSEYGYIFGAYLLPLDFRLDSNMVGVARDGKKLLLTECRYRDMYQIIRPNGERDYIRKYYVRIVN